MGIELLAPQFPESLMSGDTPLTAEQAYGESVVGKILIESINVLVGIGTVVIWIVSGLFVVLKDLFTGMVDASKVFRSNGLPDIGGMISGLFKSKQAKVQPSEEDPKIAAANALIKSAIDGDFEAIIKSAEALHGKPIEQPGPAPTPKPTTRRRTTKKSTK